ncbi:uncharacterized protein NECHADRAFT_87875 [Fusarium vanettenii 77-13-4]|uniref:Xylanolytic transcriptional activator regulatory domain-containing protein n=1 Tax=Fusarium vanettenii (strain ATCC MYA-4622 / CBS 123669 / FGSC 9596 / NRRL 45880 / 77-13-4) TaxID=660122 RepID=C7Z399_FUSV7|nr:uncharacterized protein NECHADRAFT_87875 [Fusarium vanettenii 77-13-4]EEU41797.1 hypothetical protein NECHADRAFT_87875 [Fusarium vanettenii 77-13-4]
MSGRDDELRDSSASRISSVPVVIHTFVDSPCSITSAPQSIFWDEFLHVRERLISRFNSTRGLSGNIEQVAHECVDLFMQFLFPNTPIAHEPTLRAGILLLGDELPDCPSTESPNPETLTLMALLRRFTLITALCAHIISVVPENLFRNPKSLSDIFFEASKSMLRTYEAYDLEHPDSTSLTIRMWHSSYAQNTTGKVGASWHYHTEACCLAQRMRLFDEASVARPSQIESQLLRINFWHLYLAEKTQIAFKSRPPIIDERICDVTLLENGDEVVSFLDPSRQVGQGGLESRIFVGFHLRRRISAAAASLINDIASRTRYVETNSPSTIRSDRNNEEIDFMIERYLKFTALANEVPPWVRRPDGEGNPEVEDSVRAYQTTCFWAQRSNIMTIFHCMRLLILQACIDHGLLMIVGLSESPLSWASRKLEIIRDFLDDLQGTPFVCIAAQGETAVCGSHFSSSPLWLTYSGWIQKPVRDWRFPVSWLKVLKIGAILRRLALEDQSESHTNSPCGFYILELQAVLAKTCASTIRGNVGVPRSYSSTTCSMAEALVNIKMSCDPGSAN